MIRNNDQTILVINDVEATRKSIEELLTHDGYRIETAGDEKFAALAARHNQPDLILVSLDGETGEVIQSIRRVRQRAALSENVPVIIFCADELAPEKETALAHNIFLSCPDNFNQLRNLINRLLLQFQNASQN